MGKIKSVKVKNLDGLINTKNVDVVNKINIQDAIDNIGLTKEDNIFIQLKKLKIKVLI